MTRFRSETGSMAGLMDERGTIGVLRFRAIGDLEGALLELRGCLIGRGSGDRRRGERRGEAAFSEPFERGGGARVLEAAGEVEPCGSTRSALLADGLLSTRSVEDFAGDSSLDVDALGGSGERISSTAPDKVFDLFFFDMLGSGEQRSMGPLLAVVANLLAGLLEMS